MVNESLNLRGLHNISFVLIRKDLNFYLNPSGMHKLSKYNTCLIQVHIQQILQSPMSISVTSAFFVPIPADFINYTHYPPHPPLNLVLYCIVLNLILSVILYNIILSFNLMVSLLTLVGVWGVV